MTAKAKVDLYVAGYADDTAIYLNSPSELPPVHRTIEVYGTASGLLFNATKIIAIALHSTGLQTHAMWDGTFQLLDTTDRCRYLGVQAGSHVHASHSWDKAGEQLLTRIRLSSQRNLTIDQRSRVAVAVIIPKLLYIGRHAWPDTRTLTLFSKRITSFIWTGQFSDHKAANSSWLDADICGLPRREGGMAVPNLRAELVAMAASTVSDWALSGSLSDHIVGDILYSTTARYDAPPVMVTPGCDVTTVHAFGRTRTLWAVGAAMIRRAEAPSQPADLSAVANELYAYVDGILPAELDWHENGCTLDLSGLTGTEVGDMPRRLLSEEVVRLLVLQILAQFPKLVYKHTQIQEVHLRAASANHPLTVHIGPCAGYSAAVAITIIASEDAPGTVAYAQSSLDAVHTLASYAGEAVHVQDIHPQTALNRMVCIWQGKRNWSQKRQIYKQAA
ncbi:unnamed protein product [Phytophthora fragariaefolia]|uniref:Unnamed protein product n=1 Tax=Phytophthora fragariaefolia TaxID=1490495 RepID=A0A9W6XWX1_9STRA|nr:unnamed protein product [Phytophthora fragariaefolia]